MTLSHHPGFTSVGDIITRDVLPRLHHAQRLPLRISCIGTALYDGLGDADAGEPAHRGRRPQFDRISLHIAGNASAMMAGPRVGSLHDS